MTAAPSLPAWACGADYNLRFVNLAVLQRDRVSVERVVLLPKNQGAAQYAALRTALAALRFETGVDVLAIEQPFVRIRTGADGRSQTDHGGPLELQRVATLLEAAAWQTGYTTIYRLGATVWRPQVGVKGRVRKDFKEAAVQMVRIKFGINCGADDNAAEAILIAEAGLALARRAAFVEGQT